MFAWAVQFPATEVIVKLHTSGRKRHSGLGGSGVCSQPGRGQLGKSSILLDLACCIQDGCCSGAHQGSSPWKILLLLSVIVFDIHLRFWWFPSTEVYSVQGYSELLIIVPEAKTMSEWQCILHAELSHSKSNVWISHRKDWNNLQTGHLLLATAWIGTAKTRAFLLVLWEGKELTPLNIWGNSRAVAYWSFCCTLWVGESRVSLELCLPSRKFIQWGCYRCLSPCLILDWSKGMLYDFNMIAQ